MGDFSTTSGCDRKRSVGYVTDSGQTTETRLSAFSNLGRELLIPVSGTPCRGRDDVSTITDNFNVKLWKPRFSDNLIYPDLIILSDISL